jgi:beta-glucosidase
VTSNHLIRSSFALLLLAFAGCETKTEVMVLECSPTAPNGVCDVGQTCVSGACVASASICSPMNLTGACTAGTTCFGGGCVLTSALCGPANPSGPCETGASCMEGACVATPSMCSATNPTGVCPTGRVCVDGACVMTTAELCTQKVYSEQPTIGVDTKGILTVDGLKFKDSSVDGQLDRYEDWRYLEVCRARDLIAKMTVEQKVGLMSEGSTIGGGTADGVLPDSAIERITEQHVRQALIRLGQRTARELAIYLNNVQKLCEAQPLGIPFVVTADPVHGIGQSTNATTGVQTLSLPTVVSPWPYPLGLGAINDVAVTRQYGDMVRQEFKGMGFRWQLGPMADLGTEPRWARVQNVFGENAFHVAKHVKACVSGFQGVGDGGLRNGIAATMKHFPGAGANDDGKDSHRPYGKWNVYPGDMFEYHSIPFQAAIDVGVAAVMPCYSIFKDQMEYDPEQVGAAFSRGLITNYLKQTLGFSGMVTSDWGTMGGNSAHGVEAMTQPERAAKFVTAGSHQLGSDSHTLVQAAFDQGLLSEADIDGAAVKILEMSFKLGIFENPYVDPEAAAAVRSPENRGNGFIAQKKAIVLLKNREHSTTSNQGARYLPIGDVADVNNDGFVAVYYDGVTDGLAGSDYLDDLFGPYDYAGATAGKPIVAVASPAHADIAVLRITARKGTYFGLDAGVPLGFDTPFPGLMSDGGAAAAVKDRDKVIDLLRIRDGWTDALGAQVAAANPNLKIVLVMHMDRPGIVKPFVNGLKTLDETEGVPGSYPLVSDPANIRSDGLGGVDAFLVDFGAVDRALLDVLFNRNLPTVPEGYRYGTARLPMEIPSSDAEVDAQFEDVPADSWNATYILGSGSSY